MALGDVIQAPGGQMIPGGLAAYGIGTIPSNAPAIPQPPLEPLMPPAPPPDPVAFLPPQMPPPPLSVNLPGPEAPAGVGLPQPSPLGPLGVSPALLGFLQSGQLPPHTPGAPAGAGPGPASAPQSLAPAPLPPRAAPAPVALAAGQNRVGRPDAGVGAVVPNLGTANARTQDAVADQIDAASGVADVAARTADDVAKAREEADQTLQDGLNDIRERQERDQEVFGEKQAAVAAAQKEVDNYKIDPNRYWNGSTGRKIGWAIAMALSGIGDALQGKSGPNPVIGMLQQTIQDDVKLQMDQRDALRAKATRTGQELDALDRFSQNRNAQEQYMLGQRYTATVHKIETAAAKHGGEMAKAQGAAASAEFKGKAAEAFQKAAEFATTDQRQRETLAEQKRATNMHVGATYAGIAAEDRRHRDRMTIDQEKLRLEQQKMELDAAVSLAKQQGKSPDDLKAMRDRAIGGEATPVLDKDGKVTGYTYGLMKQRNGDLWVPVGTEASVTKLQEQHASAIALVQTLDKIRSLGPEWMSDTANSDKKRKLDQLMGDARLQAIAAKGLGVPTGHDIELAENFLGTSDPTKARNQLAGIIQSRESIVRDHNVNLHTHGYDKEWVPADPNVPDAVPAETRAAGELERQQTPLELGAGERGGAVRSAIDTPTNFARSVAAAATPGGEYKSDSDRRVADAEQTTSNKYPGLAPSQEQHMDALLAASQSKDAGAAARARQALIATVSSTATKRPEYAASILNVLREHQPEIYRKAIATLPDDQRKLRQEQDQAREGIVKATPWKKIEQIGDTDPAQAAAIARHKSLAELEKVAGGGSALARQELTRRAYAEIQRRGGAPTTQAQIDEMPAYSALLRMQPSK